METFTTTADKVWTKTNDYYNREVVTCDVWSRPCPRSYGKGGMLYVMNKDSFTYTVSMGANSDYSFTGCFFECTKIKTIEDAMNAIDKLIVLHLSGKSFRSFIETLK